MLGGGDEVGIHGLNVLRLRLTAPADHEPFHYSIGLVNLGLRDHRLAEATGRLGNEGERHDRYVGEVLAGGVVINVEEWLEPPGRREHRDRGLHVDPDVT